jgi:glycerol transport system permease protein
MNKPATIDTPMCGASNRVANGSLAAGAGLYILFLMLPIYWLINMSFKTNAEILSSFTLFPREPTLQNYITIFTDPSWYTGYINSLIYVA